MSVEDREPLIGPGSDIRSIIQNLIQEGRIEEAGELKAAGGPGVFEALCGSKSSLLSRAQALEAAVEAKVRRISLPAAAIRLGFVSKVAVLQALSKAWNAPYVDLEGKRPSTEEIRRLLTPEFVWKSVLPFAERDGALCLAMSNPGNRLLIEHIEELTGKKVRPFLALPEDILAVAQEIRG